MSGIYWGAVFQKAQPPPRSWPAPFEQDAGKPVSLVQLYYNWGLSPNHPYTALQLSWLDQIRAHGAIPLITWSPTASNLNSSAEAQFQMRKIYGGQWDAFLIQWANDARRWGYPFFLRFGPEMNANFYSWSDVNNGNSPGDFAKAWRYIWNIFKAQGATNVTWVWSPWVEDNTVPPYASLAQCYPGDAYVDWLGMDGYNWFGGNSFSSIFTTTYTDLLALSPTKPIMISETGAVEYGSIPKPTWIMDAFTVQLPTNFPQIRAVCWFNINWCDPTQNPPGHDFRIESSEASRLAFQSAISGTIYVSNTFGHIVTSPISPP